MADENKKHECECGEDHDHEHEHNTVTLMFDDDEEVVCEILGTFDVEDKQYIALVPEGDDEVIIYGFNEVDGEPNLDQIESDEEYDKVADVFFELFGDEDFEEGEDEE